MIYKKLKILIIGILFGILFWLIESLVDTYIFIDRQNFIGNLLFPTAHELYMRILVIFLLIISAIYSQFLLNKKNKSKVKLEKSEENYKTSIENIPDVIYSSRPMIYKKLKILIIGILFGILFWLIESIVHTYIFIDRQNFIGNLLFPTAHELYMRILVIFLLIISAIYSQFLFNKINKSKEKLEKSENKYKTLIENIPDVIYSSLPDENGTIIYISNKVRNWTGFSPEDCYNDHETWLKSIHPEDREKTVAAYIEAYKNKKAFISEYRVVHKDSGQIFYLKDHGIPIKNINGNVIRVERIVTDITRSKKAEQKLKISEEKYRKAYERAEFFKDIFTHDMNNIFYNILSTAELNSLLKDNPDKSEDFSKFFEISKNQILRGVKLINNIRKLSKLEESEIVLEAVEIHKVLDEAIIFANKSCFGKKLNVKIMNQEDKEHFVFANEFLLDVFENLLHNAIKYNENPTINVKILISRVTDNKKNYLKIEFMDNGIGISDDRKDLIFQKGHKKDNHVRGIGIGLSLVKKIIESYNGEIWVENRVPKDNSQGSNFVLLIPEVI